MAKEKTKKVELVAKDGTTAKDVNQQFIINYCVKNNEIAWLKEQRNAEVKALKYPLSDAPVNEGGRRKQDKTKPATTPSLKLSSISLLSSILNLFPQRSLRKNRSLT